MKGNGKSADEFYYKLFYYLSFIALVFLMLSLLALLSPSPTHAAINQWSAINTGLTNLNVQSVAISPTFSSDTTLFVGTNGGGVFKSTDGGNNWSAVNAGLSNLFVQSVAVSPAFSTDGTLFAGTFGTGVFKSTDGGNNWSAVNAGLTNLGVLSVAVSPAFSSDGTLFAGTLLGGIFKSTDGGNNWSAINTGLTFSNVNSVAVSPAFSSDGTLFVATGGGVFKTTNGGTLWSAVNTGLTDLNARSIAISPTFSSDTTLFVGTNGGGVFKSTDGGNNWSAVNAGLTNLFVASVAISPTFSSDRLLFAGTLGGGVFSFTFMPTPTRFISSKVWDSGIGFGRFDSNVIVSGDFNGDGIDDVAALSGYSVSRQAILWVFLSNGTTLDAPVIWWDSGPNNWDADASKITAGDYNNDNIDDVAILYGYQATRQSIAWVFTSSGTAFNSPIAWWSSGPGNWDWDGSKLTSGDYDNDGVSDLGVLYGYQATRETRAWVFISNGTAFNSPTVWWSSGPGNWDWDGSKLTTGDYNGDGSSDFGIFYGYQTVTQAIAWVLTSSGTAFNSPVSWWNSGPGNWDGNASKFTSGDYNGNGSADLASLYYYGGMFVSLFIFTST